MFQPLYGIVQGTSVVATYGTLVIKYVMLKC